MQTFCCNILLYISQFFRCFIQVLVLKRTLKNSKYLSAGIKKDSYGNWIGFSLTQHKQMVHRVFAFPPHYLMHGKVQVRPTILYSSDVMRWLYVCTSIRITVSSTQKKQQTFKVTVYLGASHSLLTTHRHANESSLQNVCIYIIWHVFFAH